MVRGGLRLSKLFPVAVIALALLATTFIYRNRNLDLTEYAVTGKSAQSIQSRDHNESAQPIQSRGHNESAQPIQSRGHNESVQSIQSRGHNESAQPIQLGGHAKVRNENCRAVRALTQAGKDDHEHHFQSAKFDAGYRQKGNRTRHLNGRRGSSSNEMAPATDAAMLPEEFITLDPIQFPFRGDLVKWWAYSLSDLFKGSRTKVKEGTEEGKQKNSRLYVCEHFPESIGCLYLSSPSCSTANYTLLRSIVDELIATRKRFTIPKPNTTVIHIRLGDILGPPYLNQAQDCFKTKCFVPSKVRGKNNRLKPFAFAQSYYDRILKSGYLAPPNETDISVVGFSYHSNYGPLGYKSAFKVSHEYRNSLVNFFEDAGYSVTNLGDREPDLDFAFITRARTFVPGGGGFSEMMGKIVTANGGRIVSVIKDTKNRQKRN